MSYRERWARRLVINQIDQELSEAPRTVGSSKNVPKICLKSEPKCSCAQGLAHDHLPAPPWPSCACTKQRPLHVCIVGVGVCGLYIAMMLDSLEIRGLTYEILEASDRAGGRIMTHRFSQQRDDYFDVGAMRFPDLPHMQR